MLYEINSKGINISSLIVLFHEIDSKGVEFTFEQNRTEQAWFNL